MKHLISIVGAALVATILLPTTLFAAISDTAIPFDIIPADSYGVEAMATDGEILYVGGSFTEIASTTRQGFAAFDIETQTLLPLDLELDGGVFSIILDGGTIYLGGDFTDVNNGTDRRGLAAFSTTTGIATSFDPQVEGTIYTMLLDGTTLYIGGQIDCIGAYVESCDEATPRNNIAAIDTTTGEATAFDPDVDLAVNALALDESENVLYAGGSFTDVNNGTTRNRLAGFDATTGVVEAVDFGDIDANVTDLVLDGNILYASGNFTTVNTAVTRNGVAAFTLIDGFLGAGQATPFDPDIQGGTPVSMYLDTEEDVLYVGGSFTTINGDVAQPSLAAFDTDTSVATDFAPVFGVDEAVLAMTTDDEGNLFIGGQFTEIDGEDAGGIAYFPVVVDETAPTIDSLTPADNTTGLDPDVLEELVIVFDEDVALSGDEGPTMGLYNAADDSEVEDVLVGEIDGDTVTLALQFALDAGASYYVLIDDGYFEDLAGNPFAGIEDETTWNFSMAAEGEEVEEEEGGGSGGGSSSHRRPSNSGAQRDPVILLMEQLVELLTQLLEQLIAERQQ